MLFRDRVIDSGMKFLDLLVNLVARKIGVVQGIMEMVKTVLT